MCGIAGILNRDGQPVPVSVLRDMTRSLAHRGPDGEGIWCNGPVGFGHRRLAILDVSDLGHQPLSDGSGRITITYNGEIYNYRALRDELERDYGFHFRSHCDSEVIPYCYLAWGERMFSRLEGMYAMALWDRVESKLLLARDPVGIKPLYYSLDESGLRFASELKGLLADPAFKVGLDTESIHRYLAQGYAGPNRSLLSGVKQVDPGTVLSIGLRDVTEHRFWRPSRVADIRDPREAEEAFMSVWPEVVGDMTQSDVPVAVLQSAGVDSSLVSLALRQYDPAPSYPLFTGSFSEQDYDEADGARQIADVTGMPLKAVSIDTEQDVESVFIDVVHHFDGQLADSSAFAVYHLCRAVRQSATVALSGDGADEFFGGYPTYRASRIASVLRKVVPPPWLRGLASGFWQLGAKGENRIPTSEKMARFLEGSGAANGIPHAHWRRYLGEKQRRSLYGPHMRPMLEQDPFAGFAEVYNGVEGSLLDRCMIADQAYYLPADMLMKVDAMSMAHSLEVRVPFLDKRVMDLAARIHPELLTPMQGPDKKLLRSVFQSYGGPALLVKGTKTGFNVPLAQMLRGSLCPLGQRLLVDEADRMEGLFSPSALRLIWDQHQSQRHNHAYVLWTLLSFAVWLKSVESKLVR